MKKPLLLLLATLLCAPLNRAAETVDYPEKDALISVTVPDGWETKYKNGRLYANPPDDDSYFVELEEMQATPDDGEAAIKEAKESIEASFKNVKYEEIQQTGGNGLGLAIMNAKGEDKDGKANLNAVLIVQPKAKKVILMLCISSQKGFEKYGEAGLEIIQGLKAK